VKWARQPLPDRTLPNIVEGIAMPRKPKSVETDDPPAMQLALKLRAALLDDGDFAPDDTPAETGIVLEPGSMFHVRASDGRIYRVRVNRTE
jgi:hypothetical protein